MRAIAHAAALVAPESPTTKLDSLVLPGGGPVRDTARTEIDRLIAQLGSDDYHERERATDKLVSYGDAAIVPLLQALRESPDPEVRKRSSEVLGRIENLHGKELKQSALAAAAGTKENAFDEKLANCLTRTSLFPLRRVIVDLAEVREQAVGTLEPEKKVASMEAVLSKVAASYCNEVAARALSPVPEIRARALADIVWIREHRFFTLTSQRDARLGAQFEQVMLEKAADAVAAGKPETMERTLSMVQTYFADHRGAEISFMVDLLNATGKNPAAREALHKVLYRLAQDALNGNRLASQHLAMFAYEQPELFAACKAACSDPKLKPILQLAEDESVRFMPEQRRIGKSD